MRSLIAVATAAVVLSAPGCEAPRPTNEVGQKAVQRPAVIDLAEVALANLPEAVAQKIPTAARLVVHGYNTNGTASASASSGVLIDTAKGPAYLGAGHAFLNEAGAPHYTDCTDTVIISRAADGGVTMSVSRAVADRASEPPIDLALVEPTTPMYADTNRARLTETAEDLPKGERVYFVNFEPTPGGYTRDPRNKIGGLSTAAVFSGYILHDGEGSSDLIQVLTSAGSSFGRVTDNTVRPGASGGAVFREDGTLIGLSVATTIEPVNIAVIENDYGVDVRNQGHQNAQVTYVQPVDRALVTKLQQSSENEVAVC